MDEELGAYTTPPNIEYPFVETKNYDEPNAQLKIIEEIIDKSGWRDDMIEAFVPTYIIFRFFEKKRPFSFQ